jgi:hypothetical protein
MKTLRNAAFLTLAVFTFTLFTPMLMQPKEAEADSIGTIISSVAQHVTIEGIKGVYGYLKKKITDHQSGSEHPDNHPTEEFTQCGASDCTTQVSSSSHHVKLCPKCKTLYYTCESHTCNNNSSTNNSNSGYYDYSWW